MKLYKRMVKLIAVYDLGQGFSEDIRELTDWLDEDSPELEKKYQEVKNELSMFRFYTKEKFIEI